MGRMQNRCTNTDSYIHFLSARNWAFLHRKGEQRATFCSRETLMTAVIVHHVKFGGWWRLKGFLGREGGWHFWHKCLRVWEEESTACALVFKGTKGRWSRGCKSPSSPLFLSLANQLAQLNQVCMLCRITNGVNKWLVFFLPPLVVGWAYSL